MTPELQAYRKKIEEKTKVYNDATNRAGSFDIELQDALRNNTDAFRVEQGDVNKKKSDLYNSLGLLDETLSKDYGNDPSLYFQNLARERSRMGTNLSNSEDILNTKRGTINEFMNNLLRRGQGVATEAGQGVQMAENDYGRALQDYQMRVANSAKAAAEDPNKQRVAVAEEGELTSYLDQFKNDPTKVQAIWKAYAQGGMDAVRKLLQPSLTSQPANTSKGFSMPNLGGIGGGISNIFKNVSNFYKDAQSKTWGR